MLDKMNVEDIKRIALKAGAAVMDIYRKEFDVEYKDDKSPLTQADKKSNEIICQELTNLYPNIPIMSEENQQVEYEIRKNWEYYWCIDPIDGTKEFIKKNDEFTVNIALIYKNIPVLGVVYAPALDEMYYAKQNEGAFKNGQLLPLLMNTNTKEKLTVVASKSHLSPQTQDFIDNLDTKEITQVSRGSSLKLCMVAEGSADIYPRLAPTMEWDTAAADAIVRESGKMSYQYNTDKPIEYNKKNLLNPWFIVCKKLEINKEEITHA
jgi:3'(2'), 5'-bisphosphate nucleotidase